MKKRILFLISAVTVISLLVSGSVAIAAKPMDVIKHSNGFPSGMHFNLNLHGRDCTTWTGDYTGNAIVIWSLILFLSEFTIIKRVKERNKSRSSK